MAAEEDTKETSQWRGKTRRNKKGPDQEAGTGLALGSQAPLLGSSPISPPRRRLWFSDSILLETFRFPELGSARDGAPVERRAGGSEGSRGRLAALLGRRRGSGQVLEG